MMSSFLFPQFRYMIFQVFNCIFTIIFRALISQLLKICLQDMDLKTKLKIPKTEIHLLLLSSCFILFTNASKFSSFSIVFYQPQNDLGVQRNNPLLQTAIKHVKISLLPLQFLKYLK